MKMNVIGTSLVLCLSGAAFAQDTIIGTYDGSYVQTTSRGNSMARGLKLEITSVQGGTVKGTAVRTGNRSSGGCGGEYAVQGRLKGDKLVLKSDDVAGNDEDCRLKLDLTVKGNKLVGTLGRWKAELSK